MPPFEGNQGQGEEERHAFMALQAGHAEENTWRVASFLLPFLNLGLRECNVNLAHFGF